VAVNVEMCHDQMAVRPKPQKMESSRSTKSCKKLSKLELRKMHAKLHDIIIQIYV
jgi:hypothetical protein